MAAEEDELGHSTFTPSALPMEEAGWVLLTEAHVSSCGDERAHLAVPASGAHERGLATCEKDVFVALDSARNAVLATTKSVSSALVVYRPTGIPPSTAPLALLRRDTGQGAELGMPRSLFDVDKPGMGASGSVPPVVSTLPVQPAAELATLPPTRPRTLGEFMDAAKLRSDALSLAPPIQCRQIALNFQPRRSARIARPPGGVNTEQKAVRNLLQKLGFISSDEAPSEEAMEAYHRMFETPLMEDMFEAIGELYGWSLLTIRGCAALMPGLAGGHLMVV